MKLTHIATTLLVSGILFTSCNSHRGEGSADSTPIDSTNVNGTAPAQYGGTDPAKDTTANNGKNVHDTGTKASNVHNAGTYNANEAKQMRDTNNVGSTMKKK